jgi:allophanate hydrolase
MLLFVNGTLMRGETLHDNLHGCTFLLETRTAPGYRLYAMGEGSYPGMVKSQAGGAAIAGELYQVPSGLVQVIFEREPPHLYLGKVELEDGSRVWGVLCEEVAVPDKPEITWFGGWRNWRAHMTMA